MQPYRRCGFAAMLLCLFLFSGCDTAVITNGNILGVQSGQFLYESGYLQANYSYSLDKVWQACEQTLRELHASNIDKQRKIASGTLTANVYEDKIIIKIEYVGRDKIAVSVLAGIGGNQLAARLIHEKIGKALSAMGTGNASESSLSSTINKSKKKELIPLKNQPAIDENEEGAFPIK